MKKVLLLLWKLSLFIEAYFQDPKAKYHNQDEFDEEEIIFPIPMTILDENSYNQKTIVLAMKLIAIKLHTFDVLCIDAFLQILDKVLVCCNS